MPDPNALDEDLVMTAGDPSATGAVDAGELLVDDTPGADVEVADLGVAHLARRARPTASPDASSADRRIARRTRHRECGVLASEIALPGTGLGQAEPVHDDERTREACTRPRRADAIGFDSLQARFHQVDERIDAFRLAPPTRPPSMSGCASHEAVDVSDVHRAAVKDAQAVGEFRRRTAPSAVARMAAQTAPGPAPASRCGPVPIAQMGS